jgi:hypothetical protein
VATCSENTVGIDSDLLGKLFVWFDTSVHITDWNKVGYIVIFYFKLFFLIYKVFMIFCNVLYIMFNNIYKILYILNIYRYYV